MSIIYVMPPDTADTGYLRPHAYMRRGFPNLKSALSSHSQILGFFLVLFVEGETRNVSVIVPLTKWVNNVGNLTLGQLWDTLTPSYGGFMSLESSCQALAVH